MYLSHFGLREPPFAMTPDPRFVYLSGRHREALAHLVYGVSAHGGFVQLTGEVGTGKTSVCRCLLEQLPAGVDAALVLQPRLTPVELLATLCDELRLPRPPDVATPKPLVDLLARHLLDAHARGRRTVLIVDEAQALAPDVLEQVRLLTNLETAREKLLQVILIGQPELATLLEQPGLRQLAQRITARYHLEPLSRPETAAYVRHRLAVAGRRAPLFTAGALRAVHRRSGGVPRLINAICDRALLGAYAEGRQTVRAATVRRAARELSGRGAWPSRRWRRLAGGALGTAAAGLALVLVTPSQTARQAREDPALAPAAAGGQAAALAVTASDAVPADAAGPPAGTLATLLADPALAARRSDALAAVLARWGVDAGPSPACGPAPAPGFECVAMAGSWRRLRRFDLPAVLELLGPRGERHYAAVTGLAGAQVTLRLGDRSLSAPVADLEAHWDGAFVIVWPRPPVALPVKLGAQGPGVDWVRGHLARLAGDRRLLAAGQPYDEALRERVAAFQRRHALVPDGIVGPETAIVLATARAPGVPRLSELAR
jgi:general secretion pathway protein A